MRTLNLGILAHVDAGKTSLTERLLHAAGVIDEIGSVDDGNTQTDSLALERQRGITIKSAVVSFTDRRRRGEPDRHARAPGLHRRGGAGAERARRRRAGRLRRGGRAGADARADARAAAAAGADADLRQQDRPPRRAPRARAGGDRREAHPGDRPDGGGHRAGHARASCALRAATRLRRGWPSCSPTTTTRSWPPTSTTRRRSPYARLRRGLAAQTRRALVHPVFFGSARTGAGVDALTAGIAELLPAAEGDAGRPVSGTVFKIERGRAGRRSPTSACARAPCTSATGWRSAGATRRRSPRSTSSTAARRSGARRSPRGRSGSSGASATSGSATRSASRTATRREPPLRAADAGDDRRRPRPRGRGARCASRSPSSPSRTR